MLKMDPRTYIIFLILANAVIFIQRNIWVEIAWLTLLLLFLCISDLVKSAVKFGGIFLMCLLLQYVIFPAAPKIISSTFFILVSYARKILPCLMIGTFIVKKVSVRELTVALRKWKVPNRLIIPISVSIRYFPTIKEEVGHIRDAMRLRSIKGIQKIECIIVPMILSAAATADELSAAAITRGIENPCQKTSLIDTKFGKTDFVCICIGVIFVVIAALLQ